MAKRAYSTDDELSKIPLDQEVLVSVPTAEDSILVQDEEDDEEQQSQRKDSTEADAGDDDAVKTLNEQLEALRESNKAAQEQLANEQRNRQRAEQAARQIAQEATVLHDNSRRSQHNGLKSSLESAQSDQEAHKKDYMSFLEAGDFKSAADAQAKMSRAAAKIVDAEKELASFETQEVEREERPARQPQLQQQEIDPILAIDQNPRLLSTEKDFLKLHPELMTDPKRNQELAVAYDVAVKKGLTRGTAAYFEFIGETMGYREPKRGVKDDDDEPSTGAAPVRRDNQGGRGLKPGQILLTKEMREIARNMGISEKGYAEKRARMLAEQQANPEKYGRRG